VTDHCTVMIGSDRVLDALLDVVCATSLGECVRAIEQQAGAVFGLIAPVVTLEGAPATRDHQHSLPLSARGRTLGTLSFRTSSTSSTSTDLGTGLAVAGVADEQLAAFAKHVAVALDNARLLEDRTRRARVDALTGLLNRGEFQEQLAAAVAEARAVPGHCISLAVFDLDSFKSINDRGGHAAGDRLLRAAAAALTSASRSSDAAFRIGGDEFALILPGTSSQDARAIAGRAAEAIARLQGSSGASWGVSSLPIDATSRDGLVALADAELYRKKGRPEPAAAISHPDVTRRLEVASRLATRLTEPRSPEQIATTVVEELNSAFGYYLAVIHRLHDDGVLRIVAGAGRLADRDFNFLAWEQPVTSGVNGRVARTGEVALVDDTALDPDYLGSDPQTDPGSELSVPIKVDGRVWGVLNLEQLATHAFGADDILLAEAIVAQTGAALHRCALLDEMEASFSTTLAVLCDMLESKDPYTADHVERVAALAALTGERVGLPDKQRRGLRYCALLHDIGKIGIRSELLTKPGPLTAAEYAEVQEHSAAGATLLSRIPALAEIAPLVRAVHERWDGDGYPDGLRGAGIPIEARIVAVCDAWHAMTADRPYRRALTAAAALGELCSGSGSQFDPEIVEAFIAMLTRCPPEVEPD
jgi:diguanylate cyclase (GGDEF)-like protein